MKEKIIRIINLIVLVILAVIVFVLAKNIPFILTGKKQNEEIDTIKVIQKVGNESVEALAPGALFELKEGTVKKIGDYWRVIGDRIPQPIYCAEKGASLNGHGKSYEEILAYANSMNGKTTGWVKDKSHIKVDTLTSRAYYFDDGSRAATDYEAYVVTFPDPGWNDWSGIKQEAIWDTVTLSSNKKVPKPTGSGMIADALGQQAAAYNDFITKVKANGGTMKKEDKTVKDKVKTNYNYDTKEYVVGPFKIDYITGDYGLVLGGIKDMYIIGEKTSRIEIKSFIIGGQEVIPKYFETMDDKHLVDITEQKYPKPNEEFYVKFDEKQDEEIKKIHIDFEWMETEATLTYYKAKKYKNIYTETEDDKTEREQTGSEPEYNDAGVQIGTKPVYSDVNYYKCTISNSKVVEIDCGFQRLLSTKGTRTLKQDMMEIEIPKQSEPPSTVTPPPGKNLQIKLAGYVWEDEKASKESKVNGIKDGNESFKKGVEVILHYQDGSIVKPDANRPKLVNPYVTGDDGYYEFNDLDSKKKYYIEFVYDGQIYQATQYTGPRLPLSNSDVNSNATENAGQRIDFNNNFAEISSTPQSYNVRRSLYMSGTNTAYIVGKYSSSYCNTNHNHGSAEEKARCSTPYGIKEIYDYVVDNAISLNSYSSAYSSALGAFGDSNETKSKLQFIEDCRISSYTNENAGGIYPIYNKFIESTESKTIGGITYKALYPEHLNIDFGLTKRETFDLALRKDVQKTTIEINGKSHVYTYDTLDKFHCNDCGYEGRNEELSDSSQCPKCKSENIRELWDIDIRLSDIGFNNKKYYDTNYSREIFASDYQYKVSDYKDQNGNNISDQYGKTKLDELNVYVTYKLTVNNQSQSVLGEVMEIVDYFDEDYEYIDERSYIQIRYGVDSNSSEHKNEHLAAVGTNIPVGASYTSRYQNSTTNIQGYQNLYITGLQNKKLSSGQTAYIYLTFKVKKDPINGEDWIRLDENIESLSPIGVGKENIVEINGYKTYYRSGTEIPNVGTVSGYSKAAGLLDIDSVPGNLNANDVPKDGNIKYENFEDDTDKAPNIRLILYRDPDGNITVRSTDGIIWEDLRNEVNDSQKTAIGNGIFEPDKDEPQINGVTVQLVELMDNGKEYIWKTFSSGVGSYSPVIRTIGNDIYGKVEIPTQLDNTKGKYIFNSYMPGNYVVRFIYGDTVQTVLPNSSTDITNAFGSQGQNDKSYNGQDYKSTTYQEGINQNLVSEARKQGVWQNTNTNLEYIWREDSSWTNGKETLGNEKTRVSTFKPDSSNNETTNATIPANKQQGYLYDITASDVNKNVSDAKDIMKDDNNNTQNGRQSATLNSREDVIGYSDKNVKNFIAEVLASHEKMPLSDLNTKLQELMSQTQMTAETGMMVIELEYDKHETDDQVVNNNTSYKISNVNLGLEERPKAGLEVNKEVTNIKLTLADGSTLFDATQKADNVLWIKRKPHEIKYKDNKLSGDPMTDIRNNANNNPDVQFGFAQLSMDEELMHGATIKISYKITVTNIGEVDYKENSFYYTGNVANKNTIVKTEPNQLVDYVANNLQFYAVDNPAWEVIDKNTLVANNARETLVHNSLKDATNKYNTVITTKPVDANGNSPSNIAKSKLLPKIYDEAASKVSDDLTLTQLITSENKTDDLRYRNITEIVKTSNDVGRRNAYSVVGNQNPLEEPQEIDTDRADLVQILPPYGNGGTNYIIAITVILSSIVLIAGIIFIKKKVLK